VLENVLQVNIMNDPYRETKDKWDKEHPDIIKKSKAKYDQNNPTWSFRPSEEIKDWLEEERWDREDGKPESNAQLLARKLSKLMKLEREGY
jgi:O-methyltransferase involved in polyketide biosynthesis